jgi:hypothetical protein
MHEGEDGADQDENQQYKNEFRTGFHSPC